MAEWLRRWTLVLKGSACMFDSRHGRFFFMIMMVERRVAAQAIAKRELRCAGMSAANVGASNTKIQKITVENIKNGKNRLLADRYAYVEGGPQCVISSS